MARKRHSDGVVLKLLREIELRLTTGSDVATAYRGVGISVCHFQRSLAAYRAPVS